MKRTVDSSLTLSPTSKNTTENGHLHPTRELSLEFHCINTFTLDFHTPEQWEKVSIIYKPVHGILLYQPKLIMTIHKLEQHLVLSFSITYHLSQLYIDNDSWAGDHEQKLCRGTSRKKIVSTLDWIVGIVYFYRFMEL